MKCVKCGAEMTEDARFCMMCGAKKGVVCAVCGAELPEIAKFCYKCGTEVKKTEDKKPLQKATTDSLAQVKTTVESKKPTGYPVWDSTPNGTCDCAVGECDCDGSIWS